MVYRPYLFLPQGMFLAQSISTVRILSPKIEMVLLFFWLFLRLCLSIFSMYFYLQMLNISSQLALESTSSLPLLLGLKKSKLTEILLAWLILLWYLRSFSLLTIGWILSLSLNRTSSSSICQYGCWYCRQKLILLGWLSMGWAARFSLSYLILQIMEELCQPKLYLILLPLIQQQYYISPIQDYPPLSPIFLLQLFLFLKMRAKSAMVRKAVTVDNEMDHQSQKTRMLEEDRKLFLRQAEEIKQKYRQEIQKLKSQNKKLKTLRDDFISNKKRKGNLPRSESGWGEVGWGMDENLLRIMLDKQKHQTKVKKSMLFTLQDKLKEVEDNKLGYIEENPMMKTIRLLENRLDKVMIKYNEAQSIQQTYDQVVKRLREERVGYDSQLAAIETCLKGKEHDFEELLLLAHDATHAKEAAFAELKRFEQRRVTVQEMRTKYIGQKKVEINKDEPQAQENPSRVQRGGLIKGSRLFNNSYKHDENYQRQELSDYEQAFRKLKEVTGVIDANQIIQKFKTQGLTTQSLEELQGNYSKKIDLLKQEKEFLRKDLQDNKYVRRKEGRERRRLDQIENDLARTTNQFQRTNLKYYKLSNELINIKAGIEHLKEVTAFYKVQNPSKGEGLEDSLSSLNTKLRMIYDIVKTDPNYMKYSYKASANAVQAMMKEQPTYKHYANSMDDEDPDQN